MAVLTHALRKHDHLHVQFFFFSSATFQFQILRKLSQDPVQTAMPSSVTPRQLTRLSWPANTPEKIKKWIKIKPPAGGGGGGAVNSGVSLRGAQNSVVSCIIIRFSSTAGGRGRGKSTALAQQTFLDLQGRRGWRKISLPSRFWAKCGPDKGAFINANIVILNLS